MGDSGWQERRESSCNSPPDDTQRKHLSRSEARSQPASRQLEASVSDQEGTEYPAKTLITKAILAADL
jgi:hypothetical protein